MLSRDVQWECIKRTSCFLRKQRGINKTFTREPLNLKNINSYRYNGLINKKAIGIDANLEGTCKGVVLQYKKSGRQNKPKKLIVRVPLTKDGRRTNRSIASIMKKGRYRVALVKAAQRRASQILRSQKPVKVSKPKRQKKEKASK